MSKKMLVLATLILILPTLSLAETKTVSFNFEYPTGLATFYEIFANGVVFTEVPEGVRSFESEITWRQGLQLYTMKAADNENKSMMSAPYALNTNTEDGKIDVTHNEYMNNVYIEWPILDGVNNYAVSYTASGTSGNVSLGDTDHCDLIDLPDGNYTITVRSVQYPELSKSFTITLPVAPLLAPEIKMESFGLADQTVIVAFDKTKVEARVDEIRMYISGTYNRALNKEGEIAFVSVPASANCVYIGINTVSSLPDYLKLAPYLKTQLEMIFVAITTYDAETGEESPPAIAYKLFADLTKTQADGIFYTAIKSDSTDLVAIKGNLNKTIAKRSADYTTDTEVYNKFPLTPAERSDINYDGITNSVDYAFFVKYYGKGGAIY